jgi:putative transposase
MLDLAAGGGYDEVMPRNARVVIPGVAHHVTQRGNNRQDVFFVDADREMFLQYLREAAQRSALRIEGYCLMTNHVHLVVTPEQEDSLATALKRVNQLYAQYVNRLHGRSGHVWQDRFFSCPLDQEHLGRVLLYVERNPVRARLCREAWQWRWSSAGAHCGEHDLSGLLEMASWEREVGTAKWRRMLARPDDDRLVNSLRLSTSRGRPLGSDRFIAKLETLLGRRLRPLPRGRPPKTAAKDGTLAAGKKK